MQAYLEAYCDVFDLAGLVRLNTTVERVLPQPSPSKPGVPPASSLPSGSPGTPEPNMPAAGTRYPIGAWRVTMSTAGEGQVSLWPIPAKGPLLRPSLPKVSEGVFPPKGRRSVSLPGAGKECPDSAWSLRSNVSE